MTIDPSHVGLTLAGFVVAIVADCNRRVRALQRTSDLHTAWLDAMIHNRKPSRANDDIRATPKPRHR
jgi:hypothetical protein